MAGRGDCPDDYCGYSPNQMGAMDPKKRAAFMPMTDLKTYPDAMKPAWNNKGLSQGMFCTPSCTGAQWKDWNGQMVVGFAGIGIHGTAVGNRLDLLKISADGSSATKTTSPGRRLPDASALVNWVRTAICMSHSKTRARSSV